MILSFEYSSSDKYVHYNGIWHKIKRNHIKNSNWNAMMDSVKHADETIQRLRPGGAKILDGHMVDHNVSDDEE